jgi:hypothetical protein
MTAPDYVEPTIGWRTWGLAGDGHVTRLSSPFLHANWQPRVAFVATCDQRHRAPEEHCGCGVYALREAKEAAQYTGDSLAALDRALGSVFLWGRVIECELGWRASHAYPQQILVPAQDPTGKLFPDLDDVLAQLSVYGVPVLPLVGDTSREVLASLDDGLFPEAA